MSFEHYPANASMFFQKCTSSWYYFYFSSSFTAECRHSFWRMIPWPDSYLEGVQFEWEMLERTIDIVLSIRCSLWCTPWCQIHLRITACLWATNAWCHHRAVWGLSRVTRCTLLLSGGETVWTSNSKLAKISYMLQTCGHSYLLHKLHNHPHRCQQSAMCSNLWGRQCAQNQEGIKATSCSYLMFKKPQQNIFMAHW